MEGMGGFSDAEFDLLGMLFPGNDPDGTCTSLSQYSMVDDESPYAVHATGVNATGVDEDYYSYCSLINVDSSFQWNGGFYVPAAGLSTVVNSERIRDEIVRDDSQVQTADSIQPEGRFVAVKGSKHKRKPAATGKSADTAVEISETPKKRPRQSRVTQKRPENARTRRNRKSGDAVYNETNDNKNNGDGENQRQEGQSPITTSCSSEDDVNSQQLSALDDLNLKASSSAPNNNGAAELKPRAGRGSATDPQSLYARKRRERINERLKILQNLIPNGTKVDISTMLEEAVHYVKFLQIQIKLLSSDEMWMYAPIAYNGKDIGLNRLFSSHI